MNITFKKAYSLFNKEAEKRTPKHTTKDWQFIMKINCIIGLAGLSGYYINDEYEIINKLSVLENKNKLSLSNLMV